MGYIKISLILFQLIYTITIGKVSKNGLQTEQHCSYKILTGKTSSTIPFTMNGNHIILEVTINGIKLNVILDNGNVKAPTILYGSPKIDSLKLQYQGNALVGGAGDGNMPSARISDNITMKLLGVEIFNQFLVVMEYDPVLLKAFEGEDGVMGGAIWDNFVVRIDFDKRVVVFTEPDKFNYVGTGEELTLGYLPDGGSTLPGNIELQNGAKISALFHLDLGSPVALSLNIGSHQEIKKPEKTIERKAFGSQGEFVEHIGRIKNLSLGSFILSDVLTSFTNTPSLSEMGNEGDIGNGIFQRFHVTFDYKNHKIFLEPNSNFENLFEFNMSGLGLLKTDDGYFKIMKIMADSPASEVDLKVNDLLLKINGQTVKQLNRHELSKMLMENGEILHLEVIRNSKSKDVMLRLQRLI